MPRRDALAKLTAEIVSNCVILLPPSGDYSVLDAQETTNRIRACLTKLVAGVERDGRKP